MKYYNLKDHSEKIDFRGATIKGQGKEKGLFFPESIPQFEDEFIQNLHQYSNEEIAYQCMKDFAGDEIPSEILKEIVAETVSFDIPLVKINEQISILELFHGPTLGFKDILLLVPTLADTKPFKNNPNEIIYINAAVTGRFHHSGKAYFC